MQLIKIPLNSKWHFSALRKGHTKVKNLHQKPDIPNVEMRQTHDQETLISCITIRFHKNLPNSL